MNKIHKLSSELISQIAAGEVIESPASLIKELIENSLDAKSTQIKLELEDAGTSKIKISDNGVGISKEDLPLVPIRHATSKIINFDDLYNISTMGFRGEALASIFSIAKVNVQSKTKEQEFAFEITSEVFEPKKTAHNNGTSITITDLFHNVPARKKYLKSEQLEFKSILEMIKKILLINPQLQFTLTHNSKTIINKQYKQDLKFNILELLKLDSNVSLFEISHTTNHSIIKGFLAHPSELSYSTNNHCYIYVNSRPIVSPMIHKAIMNGIGTDITSGRFPLYVIDIIIDPQLIDVNIHPSKKEIKFEQEHIMYESISKAIKDVFKKELLFKSSPKEKELNKSILETKKNLSQKTLDNNSKFVSSKVPKPYKEVNYYSQDTQHELVKEDEETYGNEELPEIVKTPRIAKSEIKNVTPNYGPLFEYLSEYRIIGQVHKTYILVEVKQGLLVIDQHVAEEKFYYELFKKEYLETNKQSQQLLKAEIITITDEQKLLFKEYQTYFEKLGFEIDEISDSQIAIRSLPLDLKGKILNISVVKDIIDSLEDFSKSSLVFEEFLIEHLSILSCKSSIRAGEELTHTKMKSIIEQLKVLQEPFNCPHGRPIIVNFSTHDLEKMFKRI